MYFTYPNLLKLLLQWTNQVGSLQPKKNLEIGSCVEYETHPIACTI